MRKYLQPQLKQLRNSLKALDLERQPPKLKMRSNRKIKKPKAVMVNDILSNQGIGCNTGTPYFMVQVGDVKNIQYQEASSLTIAWG